MSWPRFWKQKRWQSYLLMPLAGLVCWEASRRLNRFNRLQAEKPPRQTESTVIVVGNLVVGGTGKTPFIIWLAAQLKQQGFSVGIISRGYGAKNQDWPKLVSDKASAAEVGDEPLMLAKQTRCPVAVSPKRAEALACLKDQQCDFIISDDGLQHYGLQRDIEIVMVDAQRQFGNQLCMPSGPLREPLGRLEQVDYCVWNGVDNLNELPDRKQASDFAMQLIPARFHKVGEPEQTLSIEAFLQIYPDKNCYALAGIGNPDRFFKTLAGLSLVVEAKPFPDHHAFTEQDLVSLSNSSQINKVDKPIVMTEKDAVKCQDFADADKDWWYLSVEASCSSDLVEDIVVKHHQRIKQN